MFHEFGLKFSMGREFPNFGRSRLPEKKDLTHYAQGS